ncbi:MAG: XRE family transcriptional regulator [Rhodospirillaceae bacterium]|nr:MAG: XRE family transcriptional regulator [Rhodospirillaceae bacterium]
MNRSRVSPRGRLPSGAPNPVDAHVGQRVRLRRLSLGMSQEKLGAALGITFQQVQKYERGANRIGASRLWDLSLVLQCSVAYFYEAMNERVSGASPRNLVRSVVDSLSCEISQSPVDGIYANRETIDLMRAFHLIKDLRVRRRVCDLTKALGLAEGEHESGHMQLPSHQPTASSS